MSDVQRWRLDGLFCFLLLKSNASKIFFCFYSSFYQIVTNMKFLILAAICAFVSCEIDLATFDWSTVVPLHQIKEWQDAHPYVQAPEAAPSWNPPKRSGRILNGGVASPNEYPYMAGVMLHFDAANSWCGGSLISVNFVLTSAKCVHIVPSTSVLLAASNMNSVGDVIRVSQMRIHPQFNFEESLNDIATLQLVTPAVLGNLIGLVRLPNRRQVQSTFENQQGTILG